MVYCGQQLRWIKGFSLAFFAVYFRSGVALLKSEGKKRTFATQSHSQLDMKTVRTDGIGGRGISFVPTSGTYSNVVIWLHGLGDTADGWASMMPSLGINDTKFILPTANSRGISLNGGMAMPGWSDIYGLDMNSREDAEGFAESADRINRIIQSEVDKGSVTNRIVIAGFSQGGALALHTSLRSQYTLGGCLALSTWLPLSSQYPSAMSAANANLKILQIHGDEDQVVAHQWGEMSHEKLKRLITAPVPEFVTIEGMGHSSDPDEITYVKRFLKSVFEQR
jgi:predicted esterase